MILSGQITNTRVIRPCCNKKSDASPYCYKHQTVITTQTVVQALGLREGQYTIAYQSQLGRDEWTTPSTEDTLVTLAKRGIKDIHIVCPAFVADCLETLAEIEEEGRQIFIEAGGEKMTYIPCLNTSKEWVNLVTKWSQSTADVVEAVTQ